MTVLLANNVSSALAAPITASATSMTVTNGSRFPVLTPGQYFYATIIATNGIVEIVKVNTRNGNAMSITRAQDGTNAQAFASGARVEMRINAASVKDVATDTVAPIDARLTTAEGDITALEGRMTTAESDITTIEGDIVALEAFDTALATSTGSTSVGFLQAGSGASLRTVQSKLRDVVSVKDFGAVGNGIADDTAAIQAALDYCEANGAFLYGAPGTYRITSKITIKCNADLSAMLINANATLFSPAVQVGPATAGQYLFNADIALPKVTNTAKTSPGWAGFDTSIGVLSANVYQSRITVPYIYSFGVGIKIGGFGVGNVYNTYTIGVLFNNKINMQCKPGTANGWSNQNTFIGGRYGYSTNEGVTVSGVVQIQLRDFADGGVNAPNTNVWVNPSIEGDEPQFHLDIQGAFNMFLNPRFEVSTLLAAKVNFHAATIGETSGNYIYSGYMFGMTYTFSGAGTSVNNGLIGARGGGTLDFSGNGYNLRNTNGNTVASPHLQGFIGTTQPLPKDQTATDWTYRLFAEGFAVKNPSDTAPRVAVDASGYVNFGGGASVAGGLRYNTGAVAITSNIDFAPDADATLSLGKSNRQWSRIWATLPTYANNAAAISGGLTVGAFYKTVTGELRVVV